MRFGGGAPDECANARITIGTTDDVGDIGPMFETARTKLRNIIDQRRAAQAIWHDVEVLGWMRVAAAEGTLGRCPDWTVTANLVIRHGALPYQEFGHLLADGWKALGQTRVIPFDTASPVQECLAGGIQHALAAWHADAAWPMEWISELYEYVEGWSRSFQSLRIDIGPRDTKRTRHSRGEQEDTAIWLEPMPVIVSEDPFSTSYPRWTF